MADPADTSIGELLQRTIASGQRLIQAQKALFEAELKRSGEQAAATTALAIVAIGTVSLFVIFLLITIAYVFVAIGLPTWAGFGIVALVLLITAIITGLFAKSRAGKISGPSLAIEELTKSKDAITSVMEQPGS